MSPSPTSPCRSRFEPSGVCESLTWRTRTPIDADASVELLERALELHRVGDVHARRPPVTRVEAQPEARMPIDGIRDRCQFGDRAADRPACARRVLHAQPEIVGGQLEELLECGNDELDRLVEAQSEVRADVEDDGFGADRIGRLHRRAERGERVLAHGRIAACEVDEVERVACDRLHAHLPAARAEALDLLLRVRGRPPHPRALREHLHRVAADHLDAVDCLRDPTRGGDMGAEQHRSGRVSQESARADSRRAKIPKGGRCAAAFAEMGQAHAVYATSPMSVRVRMAPSPTGFLHIGGVRTFLFNWLFARGHGGECLLRIENTDTSREVAESVEQIERSLRWLGIEWDGDTTFQLDVMERAKDEALRLVAEGTAYEDEGAIRIRMPDEGSTGWDDAIKGRIEVPNVELEDVVLVRSDGRPTYNFASPLEDWLDAITHVIRGDDHVSNTPKQVNVLRALGAEPPVYAHVPNVFGADGKKLSKRHGAVSVDEFRSAGYAPEALMNFLALLGWAPDGETTIMSREELVERFSLERVGSSPATFDYAKLDWMNGVYLRELARDEYATRLVAYLRERGNHWPEERVRAAAPIVQEKIGRFEEFPGFAGFLFHDVEPDRSLLDARILAAAVSALESLDPWTAGEIEVTLKRLCEELGEKPRSVYLPVRVAVTGSRVSPGLYESLELLGKDTSLERIRAGVAAA